jgi:hypothetical protein
MGRFRGPAATQNHGVCRAPDLELVITRASLLRNALVTLPIRANVLTDIAQIVVGVVPIQIASLGPIIYPPI